MLLLRHASAGDRLASATLDRARPLDRAGRADANALPEALAGHVIEMIVTSPHARCLETVAPIALASRLVVECREELAPDAPRRDTLSLLEQLPGEALLCTHREVIERLFRGEVACEKGGAWLVEKRGGRWAPVAYLAPPTSAERARQRAVV